MADDEAELESLARDHYEAARKNVSGRPAWEDLNPNDPYDVGMKRYAYEQAEIILADEIERENVAKYGPRGVGHDN